MARQKKSIPKYGTVELNGSKYYRTRIKDTDGKRFPLYAKTPEELYAKVEDAKRQIADAKFHKENPTVAEYCEKWLQMHSAQVSKATLKGYESRIRNYIIKPLGDKYLDEVTLDDVKLAMVPVSKKSVSVYRTVHMLLKTIFESAVESGLIEKSPCAKLPAKGGKAPNEKEALSDDQVVTLLEAIKGHQAYVFVMIGLYAGLRREEILGLQWDAVFLDADTPYLSVQRAWRAEHNRPVVTNELKTRAARRDIPIPAQLLQCLKVAKETSNSDYVIANKEGKPLSYTQFKLLWKYIDTRSTRERSYVRYVNGQKVVHTVTPVLGEKAAHNGNVVYSMDFKVTPHQLRHTYITNLIYKGVDPKTVQYLAGHENIGITMNIYAKVKYHKPEQLAKAVNKALGASTGHEKS